MLYHAENFTDDKTWENELMGKNLEFIVGFLVSHNALCAQAAEICLFIRIMHRWKNACDKKGRGKVELMW